MRLNTAVREAYERLYSEHWSDTVAQARTILRGYSDPADVAATAYTRLWAEVAEGRAEHLHDRLIELTNTIAETERTRERREEEYLGYATEDGVYVSREGGKFAPEIAERLTAELPTPEVHLFGVEFDAAMRSLTQKQRETFALTELRGLSTVEAASVLGVTQQAAHSRKARARAAIAYTLTEGGTA